MAYTGRQLCDMQIIREILTRHGFHFSKQYGQNFLTEGRVPAEITDRAGINRTHGVLEIGPGMGALTWALAQSAGHVAAVEVDRHLLPVLAETLEGLDNVTLIPADILKTDLRALSDAHFGGLTPVVCANLPYSITTPVLTHLLASDVFETLTVMVQKEVAQRLCARAGTPEYGSFTVYVGVRAEAEILFDVPPHCFTPRPKVTSSVVRLTRRPIALRTPELFNRVVRAAFGQRRKTLVNALSGVTALSKARLTDVITACGHTPMVRGETLDIAAFELLSYCLSNTKE